MLSPYVDGSRGLFSNLYNKKWETHLHCDPGYIIYSPFVAEIIFTEVSRQFHALFPAQAPLHSDSNEQRKYYHGCYLKFVKNKIYFLLIYIHSFRNIFSKS